MFKFLKDKLKGAISKISKKAEEEGELEEIQVEKEKQKEPSEKPEEEKIDEKQVDSSLDELDKQGEELLEPKIEEEKEQEQEESKEEEKEEHGIPTVEKRETTEPIKVEEPEETKEIPEGERTFDIEEIQIEQEKQKREKAVKMPSPRAIKQDAKAEEETPEPEKKGFLNKVFGKKEEKPVEHAAEAPQPVQEKKEEEQSEEKKGFFSKVTEKIVTTKISQDKFEDLFSDLEMILLENNVAFEVVEKIKSDLEKDIVDKPIKRTKVEETIVMSLRDSIEDLFDLEKINVLEQIKNKEEKPFVIAFFGINGSGKTTSIAKLGKLLQDKGVSVVLAAADTFRAAAVEQLEHHGNKLGLKVIKQGYGSDPAAVAFDAIKHAQSKNIDCVLIDTAGRLHSNTNLLQEMEKIIRIAKPDLKIFVGESITGNDCIEQAKSFNESVGIDGLILTKADVDEKGGAAISVGYVTQRPILYIGVGQAYTDLKEFDSKIIVESLGL